MTGQGDERSLPAAAAFSAESVLAAAFTIADAQRATATANAIGDEITADPVQREVARLFDGDPSVERFERRASAEIKHLQRRFREHRRAGSLTHDCEEAVTRGLRCATFSVLLLCMHALGVHCANRSRVVTLADLPERDDGDTWPEFVYSFVKLIVLVRERLGEEPGALSLESTA
jgi:hypothetical protein